VIFLRETVKAKGAKVIPFGPVASDGYQLSLPERVTATVDYSNFKVDYTLFFNGERMVVESVNISGVDDQGFVSTRDLTQLNIPKVIRDVVYKYNSDFGGRLDTLALKDRITLAQYYFLEFTCDGSPRKALMDYMDWSRTNANFHITKYAKAGMIPADRVR